MYELQISTEKNSDKIMQTDEFSFLFCAAAVTNQIYSKIIRKAYDRSEPCVEFI